MREKVELPPPDSGKPSDLLVIAGEHSGDQHAARMVRGLLKDNPDLSVSAVAGKALDSAGAQVIFDLTRHSVVGFVEVIRNYGFFKEIFDGIIAWIEEHRPRNVCLVDFPGFNLRLARELFRRKLSRKGGGAIAVLYYISPQIWAWKAGRRFKMAEWLDDLGVIFPFEVECYADTDLPVTFVGHPFLADDHQPLLHYDVDGPILLLPGSRRQPVNRIFPAMLDTFLRLHEDLSGLRSAVVFPDDGVRAVIEDVLASRPGSAEFCSPVPVGDPVGGRAVLTSSGTISLACGIAGIPGAIAYRAHPITCLWGRFLIQVPYLGIVNLLLDRPEYPEYIQSRAKPVDLCRELRSAIENPTRIESALTCAENLRRLLAVDGDVPDAAAWLSNSMVLPDS